MDKIICNPLNLEYQFRNLSGSGQAFRSCADPSLVLFKGRYFLFSSTKGFYYSDDLYSWTFVSGENLPVQFGAPDIREVDGWLYQCASDNKEPCPIYRTKAPLSGEFEEVSRPFIFWDPNMFEDDDGRVYLYWGCSNKLPIYGVEMDKETMMPIGDRVELIFGHPEKYGWERNAPDNNLEKGFLFPGEVSAEPLGDPSPWIEGPWMTKHGGKYYLQYAGPATELNVYSNGVYVSDTPLGPFTYEINNPMSTKPGGFIPSAGHGSTLQDQYGNWWHIASMLIGVNNAFERRVGIFPAGFDDDGVMFCNNHFGDYPMLLPDHKMDPLKDSFPGWMLLSYKKAVTASSALPGFPAENIADENIRTYWAAAARRRGEYIVMDLGGVVSVNAVQLNFMEHNLAELLTVPGNRLGDLEREKVEHPKLRWLLEGSQDGENWEILCDKRTAETSLTHDFICFDAAKKLRYIKLTGFEMPFGSNLALSGMRVFGNAGGNAPGPVQNVKTERFEPMSVNIAWDAVPGADGYNVCWGTSPEKLYNSWMVYGQNELTLRMLTEGVDYFVSVDAFNGSGITKGSCVAVKSC